MSQKSSKRNRQRAGDDVSSFKTPSSSKNKDDTNSKHESSDEEYCLKGFNNGNFKSDGTNGNDSPSPSSRVIQTRSRSSTPLIKTKNDDSGGELEKATNGDELSETSDSISFEVVELSEPIYEEIVTEHEQTGVEEMGPLVLEKDETVHEFVLPKDDVLPDVILEKDEILPELQFEENDSECAESESSPNRCKTRRSDNFDVPTPKTPKITVEECNKVDAPVIELDDTSNSDSQSSISTDNISTRAVVGSDVTRNADLTYQEQDITSCENTYLSPNRSINDSYKSVSSRRTIRPISNDYRKFVLKNSLNAGYESERIIGGVKRKNRSVTPENSKRFKDGFLSYLTSPIANIKNTFSKSSTPTLVGYTKNDGESTNKYDEIKIEEAEQNGEMEKKWCSIM